jgi:hypothetical protein
VTDVPSDDDDDTLTDESRQTGTHGRSPLTWTVAVVVVLLIAAAVVYGLVNRGSDDPETPPGASEPGGTSLDLMVAPATKRCMVPNVEVLRKQAIAFDGVVQSVSGGQATLRPSRFYAGEETDVVVVKAPDDDLQALLAAVEFREGVRYLVSATGGRVTLCGFSGPYTDLRAELYDEAFGG